MPQLVDDHKTSDLSESQPTKGNIEGGLTTIEEKGAAGQYPEDRAEVQSRRAILTKTKLPTGPELRFMDSSSAAAEMVTLCGAAGLCGPLFPDWPGQHHRQTRSFR